MKVQLTELSKKIFEEIDLFSKLIIIFKDIKHGKSSESWKISFPINMVGNNVFWTITIFFQSALSRSERTLEKMFKVINFSKCVVTNM